MASPVVNLTFDDGSKESVVLKPGLLVEIERHFKGNIPGIEGSMWGAWHGLGRPGKFDEWKDTVASIDESAGDEPDPTEPEASDGS